MVSGTDGRTPVADYFITIMQQHQSANRVRRHTAPYVNRRIDLQIEKNIQYYAAQPAEVISHRIEELDAEWDIERALETNAATLALTGLLFGIIDSRKWLTVPLGVLSFLLLHGVSGWCPPVAVLRRAGVRTREEIEREKFALKYLRGDFEHIETTDEIREAGELAKAVGDQGTD